jgi:signal peptidase I
MERRWRRAFLHWGWLLGRGAQVALLAGLLFLAGTRFVGQGYRVEGQCMEPWLRGGERILGEKWTFRRRAPRRGEVIIFRHPVTPSQLYIKRIVALGGETVEIRRGTVYVNRRPLSEPYRVRMPRGSCPPHRVAPGSYFVLGDNRDASDDSRRWGDVDRRAVVARAWLRYGSLHRWAAPF